MKRILVLLLAPVVLAGCSSVSNLSATRTARDGTGFYTVEAKFSTQRRAIIDESIRAFAVVGDKSFELKRVPLVKDRWEGQIIVDPTQKSAHYHFQFEYKVNRIPKAKDETSSSPEYGIDIK